MFEQSHREVSPMQGLQPIETLPIDMNGYEGFRQMRATMTPAKYSNDALIQNGMLPSVELFSSPLATPLSDQQEKPRHQYVDSHGMLHGYVSEGPDRHMPNHGHSDSAAPHHMRHHERALHHPEHHERHQHQGGKSNHENPLLYRHEVSDQFTRQAIKWLDSIPNNHRHALSQAHYKVEIVKDVATYDKEHHTHYATEKPEGWPAGSSGKNLDCFFDSKNNTVVVLEHYTPIGTNIEVKTADFNDMGARMRHEIGHAYDQALKFHMEHDPVLQIMYEDDLRKLNNSPITRQALQYYLQPNERDGHGHITSRPGLRETIAEIYAQEHGGGADLTFKDKSLRALFSDLFEYMHKHGY
ncbi:MAG TPA: hypothetical protein V6C72_18505 [Chroococcales cyanobacterium]